MSIDSSVIYIYCITDNVNVFLMFPNLLPIGFETVKIKNVILNNFCWYGIADDVY